MYRIPIGRLGRNRSRRFRRSEFSWPLGRLSTRRAPLRRELAVRLHPGPHLGSLLPQLPSLGQESGTKLPTVAARVFANGPSLLPGISPVPPNGLEMIVLMIAPGKTARRTIWPVTATFQSTPLTRWVSSQQGSSTFTNLEYPFPRHTLPFQK